MTDTRKNSTEAAPFLILGIILEDHDDEDIQQLAPYEDGPHDLPPALDWV